MLDFESTCLRGGVCSSPGTAVVVRGTVEPQYPGTAYYQGASRRNGGEAGGGVVAAALRCLTSLGYNSQSFCLPSSVWVCFTWEEVLGMEPIFFWNGTCHGERRFLIIVTPPLFMGTKKTKT